MSRTYLGAITITLLSVASTCEAFHAELPSRKSTFSSLQYRRGSLYPLFALDTTRATASTSSSGTSTDAVTTQSDIPTFIESMGEPSLAETTSSDLPSNDDYQRGLLTIAFITVLFSSNSPVLHSAFVSSHGHAPPVLLLNAATSCIALGGLALGGPLLDATVPLPCTLEKDALLACDNALDERSVKAGLELGLWKMLGTTANLYGLSLTSADHGAFLIQLTTLIVPVVQGIQGVPIPTRIWTAIGLALAGVFTFTQESSGAMAESSTLLGDGLCVLAAIFYATYDLRLFDWGKKVAPLRLITNKIAVQAILSLLLLLACGSGDAVEYVHGMMAAVSSEPAAVNDALLVGGAALWSGLVINAVAPFLQVGGQQAVGASRAQVVYASQPLWAAILSFFLLNETVGPVGAAGGTMFLGAMFLAATAESPEEDCGKTNCEV